MLLYGVDFDLASRAVSAVQGYTAEYLVLKKGERGDYADPNEARNAILAHRGAWDDRMRPDPEIVRALEQKADAGLIPSVSKLPFN